jgi:hypothetical protein
MIICDSELRQAYDQAIQFPTDDSDQKLLYWSSQHPDVAKTIPLLLLCSEGNLRIACTQLITWLADHTDIDTGKFV